ncbi:MAG: hypothetical protein C4534_05400 [Gaiellales bacterium]|nr:MAG: hypothetical protein C4534_05400 [Gaiellales bacterium]
MGQRICEMPSLFFGFTPTVSQVTLALFITGNRLLSGVRDFRGSRPVQGSERSDLQIYRHIVLVRQ